MTDTNGRHVDTTSANSQSENGTPGAAELQAGMPAEEVIQLPARDTRKSDKAAKKQRADIDRARRLRETHGHADELERDAGRQR